MQGKKNEVLYDAFDATIERLCEGFFYHFFTGFLCFNDVLRVLDNVLIHGFEFIHKFGLSLLSNHESLIKNNIKQELKLIDMSKTLDSLTIAGRVSANKFLTKSKKIQVENMLKKTLTKPNYQNLKRNEITIKSNASESLLLRVLMLKYFKNLLDPLSLSYEVAYSFITQLEIYDNNHSLARSIFQNFAFKNFN